jgi:hypothetical protein
MGNAIIAGFKPTDVLNVDSNIYLKDLFYSGGLRGYLKCLMKN